MRMTHGAMAAEASPAMGSRTIANMIDQIGTGAGLPEPAK
jgi:hypothetical protein